MNNWNGRRPILKRLKERILRPKIPLNKSIAMATYILEASLNKLKQISLGLKRRDDKFFLRCIEAQIEGDRVHAVMYANECAEVRKLAQLVLSSELALEQAILRLQTIEKLSNAIGAIVPIVGIVNETKGRLLGVVPAIANKLDDVNTVLSNSLREMGTVPFRGPGLQTTSDEAMKVLEEANAAAEEKIRERFPALPADILTPDGTDQARVPVALTATGGDQWEVETALKQQVYDYIKQCNGQLSIIQCASYLGVFPTDVERAILKLKEEGKITLG